MTRTITFTIPVRKKTGGAVDLIEVGDDIDLVLRDGSIETVEATAVSNGARTISWDDAPRTEDVRAVNGNHQLATAAGIYGYHDGDDASSVFDPVISG